MHRCRRSSRRRLHDPGCRRIHGLRHIRGSRHICRSRCLQCTRHICCSRHVCCSCCLHSFRHRCHSRCRYRHRSETACSRSGYTAFFFQAKLDAILLVSKLCQLRPGDRVDQLHQLFQFHDDFPPAVIQTSLSHSLRPHDQMSPHRKNRVLITAPTAPYSSYFLISSVALCPPKPNEFDMA